MTSMDQSPDPVAEPDAYRATLLGALGDDDLPTALASSLAALKRLIEDAGDLVRVRPEPAEWSVLECVGHIVDAELVVSTRVRWIISEDQPDIVGYDQDLWVDGLRHDQDDPAILLALFEGLRRANLDLWARVPVEARARVGLHRERGAESYELTTRLSAGHDRVHIAQAHRALARLREDGGRTAR
jgi:DinB superfamily